MQQAMTLADSVRGHTSPNPAVGAVVLTANGELAGAGATRPIGGPHAERVALDEAGADRGRRNPRRHSRAVRAHRPHPAVC